MEEFVKKLKKGDVQAFEKLVKEYQKKIYSTCCMLLSDAEDAEDAVQDVFIKIYNNISSFNEKSLLSTWIYKITQNTCYDYLRKKKNVVFDEIPETLADDKFLTPEQAMEKMENVELVRECIKEIPLKYRTVLILREFDDMSYGEIADACDISEGTVKSRIYRAREYLLKLISEKGNKF